MNMCGEIDEEITIPELVKEGSLCPHQDYVYFNYPTKEEEKEVRRFEERSKAMTEKIMRDTQFLTYVRSHKGFSGQLSDDLLLDNPAYLASLLIYLQSKNIAIPSRLQRLLGAKKLPDMNVQWMERLLQGFLYDDVDSYLCDKTYRELLIADLKSDGLIEKKKVVMTKSAAVEKMLTNSLGKCNSIRDIVFHEYEASGQDLRLLVLTDYIRKEYEKAIGNTEYDVNSLGVLPFFEMLRRDNEKKNEQIRFGVLCGTIVIIPAEAREALEQAIGMSGKVTFSRIGNLSETDYLKVTAVGNAHFLTGAVTDIFSKGYMQVLIGTKSLLGEGWDSPCINSLILASFVGSFMLSNQMRGRAIRVMKEHPEKTSNIWHLVCLRPWNEVLKADDNQISEDYSMLERRMEHFLGLHYTENTIENGMKRLSVIKTPFNKTNIDRINRQMLKMSGQRDTLKERWNSALAVYDKMDIVDETEVKDKFVTSVVFWDAILTMILSGILCLIGAIGAGIVAAASQNGILAGTCYFFIAAGLAGIMIRFPKIFMLGSPLKRLKAFGNGIRKALEEQQLLEETHCKVETESNGPDKLEKLVATIRSREISACLVLQAQSQLKAIYKDNADTIIGNMDTSIFLGGKEPTTLKELAAVLGKETIDTYNTGESRGRETSHSLNYQKLGKELMSQDELAVMDGGKCILQLRGVRPFLSDKYDITRHPNFKYTADADKRNTFDIEAFLSARLKLKPDEVCDVYEVDTEGV